MFCININGLNKRYKQLISNNNINIIITIQTLLHRIIFNIIYSVMLEAMIELLNDHKISK